MFNGSIPVRSNGWKLHSLLVPGHSTPLPCTHIETDSDGKSGREEEMEKGTLVFYQAQSEGEY